MNFNEFSSSLSSAAPPERISVYLEALWYDGKNDWDKAHDTIQDVEDKTAAWIHAYLHRKEGDVFNANYWYNRAGKRMPGYGLEQEWKEIVEALI
ncbi:MAG TPA: hypothetical protein VD993_12215 [Chitinophagaceae bacterium]|nr:hypothetical protein [Chitinophagaceae bacterium]